MTRTVAILLMVVVNAVATSARGQVDRCAPRDAALPAEITEEIHQPAVKLHLAGAARGTGLKLMAELGVGVTRAVRVYSEPSGTLLAVYVNGDVPEPVNATWLDRVTADAEPANRRFGVMTVPFHPGVKAVINTAAAPSSDTKLKVWIFGSWPDADGTIREQEIPFSVTTNLADFAFTYTRHMRPDAPGLPRHLRRLVAHGTVCCGTQTDCGGRSCKDCTESEYCCSKETSTVCGWCNKNLALCGSACEPC